MTKNKLTLEESFNLLVQLARQQKLTWDEHQRVSEAIDIVLKGLNGESDTSEKPLSTFVSHLGPDIPAPPDESGETTE